MAPVDPAPTLIGSVQRALRLLEAAAGHPGGAPAKQLAREAEVALPTAYHLLRTLAHEGYVRRDRGVYLLAEAAERLGGAAVQQNRRGMINDALAYCRDILGAPVYLAVYREGEIEIVAVADTPAHPAVEEWADFRETGHAHAIGQCLLSQLGEKARRDHLDRHPIQYVTPYSVRSEDAFLRRLAAVDRMQPVLEHQEYALGTVCAAIPLMAGNTAMAIGFSLPTHQEERLLPTLARLEREVGKLLGTLGFSISI
ncbi:IclR family transcriptional regulator [Streptomyces uncialis]|uniref:IclR family transcriptional regulator n=1 Tax=Streptomyces uncialis TaxID=1048205 RepID=UPI003865823B|nr:helix-turn-helix domain-containing protein [Streptomyces uncialis]